MHPPLQDMHNLRYTSPPLNPRYHPLHVIQRVRAAQLHNAHGTSLNPDFPREHIHPEKNHPPSDSASMLYCQIESTSAATTIFLPTNINTLNLSISIPKFLKNMDFACTEISKSRLLKVQKLKTANIPKHRT
jgi:hypothetical protein